MKHLLRGVAFAVLIAAAVPAIAAKPAPAGAPIIPPADPAAAKAAASPAPAKTEPNAAPAVTATAIRHDRPMRHRIAWHYRHARHHHRWRGVPSDHVAEQLNIEELHRMAPSYLTPAPRR